MIKYRSITCTQMNKPKRILQPLNTNYVPNDIESEVLKFWESEDIFHKSITNRPADNQFSFFDGPPFITGLPHYGHLLGSIVKDVIPRFQTMKGKRVRRVWGWDCHGLPAENKVEKQLGLNSKKEIESLGIDKFVDACKTYVNNISAEWEWYVDRIGRWVDFKNAYKTMDENYMESVLWVFKQLYDKDLIYKGKRVSLFCPRCSTPLTNFEIAMDNSYKDVSDPSVVIKFKSLNNDTYFLAWTTTPWTLPSNFALGVNSDETYAQVESDGEKYVLALARVEEIFASKQYSVSATFKGSTLVGSKYQPVYDYYQGQPQDWQIYDADFVSMTDGTGIVHIAPGFGEDDTQLGLKHHLSMVDSVDDEGHLDPRILVGSGKFFKAADKLIMADLESRQLLFSQGKITHSYPHCYRCETPLLFKAQDAWYLSVTKFKDQLHQTNQDINWIPDYFKTGRFKLGIDSAPDWCISRSRYWGTPLPVWECECGTKQVFGSINEIETAAKVTVKDLHRPAIDQIEIACPKCGQKAKRVKDVLDCWLESASMPYAQIHYPFENKQLFDNSFPADFITEYTGQLRAWFYVMHVVSNALNHTAAFKNVIVTGVIQGNDGRKMSKNYGNYPDPKDSLQKYGADSLRLYLMGSPIVNGQDIAISEKDWQEQLKTTLMILFNSYKFFVNYASSDQWEISNSFVVKPTALDQWVLARLDETVLEIETNLSKYSLPKAIVAIKSFVGDLSTWYVRRSRDRVGPSATNIEDKHTCYVTFYQVFEVFLRAIAPITPFISDYLYRHLTTNLSVHLEDYPVTSADNVINHQLIEQMKLVRQVVELGHSSRKLNNMAVKQPLASLSLSGPSQFQDLLSLENLIREELNVEKVIFKEDAELSISLDLTLDDRLRAKGKARELVRTIQEARKAAGCRLDEWVSVTLPEWPEQFEDYLKQEAMVTKITRHETLTIIRAD